MDATFWALVGLIIFLGIVFYLKVPATITKSLDDRSSKISDELEEARKLREEAQAMVAEFQGKRQAAEKDAEEIVAAAKREADNMAKEAAVKTEEFVMRRTALAEQKIAQAEASAVEEVRAKAIDVAVEASQQLIAAKATGKSADGLIKDSMAEIKAKLN